MATKPNAKVAAIVSETSLALNSGSANGVKVGDKVTVFRAVEVNDPDSRESLGQVLVPKLTLEVTEVEERLSVATVTDVFVSGANRFRKTITASTRAGNAVQVPIQEGDPAEVVRAT